MISQSIQDDRHTVFNARRRTPRESESVDDVAGQLLRVPFPSQINTRCRTLTMG